VVTHRYVGVVMGLLMLLWFASGVGMLFVHWPEVTPAERAAGLAPIRWERCCAFGDLQNVRPVRSAAVEDLAGRPVLRLDGETIDLAAGRPLDRITPGEAAQVATAYAAAHDIAGRAGTAEVVDRDQWTVTGYFDKRRPFYVFRFEGPARTDVYVSARTGAVSQVVNAREKVLNWLGPIPHWLYFETLRADTKLWTQVVIWTSIVGVFLTLTGLYLGVAAWRPWRDTRVTPYRGLMAWHHLTGLAAGLLTLTWVASGLVSMNPWGFLDGRADERTQRLTGVVPFGDVRQAVLAAKSGGVAARQLAVAPLGGTVFVMADGVRLDAAARAAPLAGPELAAAARRMGPSRSAGLIAEEDAYYFGHHEPVTLPAYRVVMADGLRIYLDPASGGVLRQVDGARRGYRWLFDAPHRLDFIRGFDRGGGWAAAMTLLLVFAGAGVATGVWLGWRRVKSDATAAWPRGRSS
jgi:hypothetical protein